MRDTKWCRINKSAAKSVIEKKIKIILIDLIFKVSVDGQNAHGGILGDCGATTQPT